MGKITEWVPVVILFLVVLLLFVSLPSGPAYPQGQVCAERHKLVAELERQHGETRQSFGLQRNNKVVETYANTDTGTWTIILSEPSGITCLVSAGVAFEKDAPINKDPES